MSGTGRRRPTRARPAARHGTRTLAALAALALGAATAVPPAIAADRRSSLTPHDRPVRTRPAGAFALARADQIRAREWHLGVLQAERAWKYSRGRGITVAVLDTGVDGNHPDLTGQVVTGPDLTGGLRRPGSRYWGLHGTSMASIIAGHGHGPGMTQGMMGVAPQSRILSIRVTLENDDPLRRDNAQANVTGEHDAVAQGIRYAVDHGADIINMSLGGGRQFYNGTQSQESAIRYALGKGVVLIASAGNDGSGANRRNFPASYPGVIAVGALDRNLRLWKDSNRRSRVSVCAPGVDIVSADANNGYVVGTGTSASSAIVAGVAALVRARYPRLTPAEVRQALIQGSPARHGRPTGSSACRGTVDALRTLYAAHRINKTSGGPARNGPPSASPAAAGQKDEESGRLLPLILGGGGALIVLGLVLGWRQRRRPDDDPVDTDAVPDYGLPAAPPSPRPPAMVAADAPSDPEPAAAPVGAPVNAPLWQSTDVYQGPGVPPAPSRDDAGAAEPEGGPGGDPAGWDDSPLGSAPLDASARASSASDTGSWSRLGSPLAPDEPPTSYEPPSGRERPGPYEPPGRNESPGPNEPLAAPYEPLAPHEPLAAPYEPPAGPQEPSTGRDEPLAMPHELRPFDPGEFSMNGRNGHGNGNGQSPDSGPVNGNGVQNGQSAFDRLGPLDGLGSLNHLAPFDTQEFLSGRGRYSGRGRGNGHGPVNGHGRHADGLNRTGTGRHAGPAHPAESEPPRESRPDDEPRGRHSRRSRPFDEDDHLPPWWWNGGSGGERP